MAGTTKVTLNLEDDEGFREYVRGQIAKQVELVMREELKGIVTSELAKLRLTDPENMPMSAIVSNAVAAQINQAPLKTLVADTVRVTATEMIRTELRPAVDQFKQRLLQGFKEQFGMQ